MGKDIARIVRNSFWKDEKIVNMFSPEDKYFFLYLLTNPDATQLGIYHFVPKTAAFLLGYSTDSVNILLERFENKYKLIKYSAETSEVAVLNFLRHSIMTGGKPVYDCLVSDADNVKNTSLLHSVYRHLIQYDKLNDTVVKFLEYIKEEYIKDKNIDTNDNDNERHVDDSSTSRVCIAPSEADKFFEVCWKAYPRKKGKGFVKPATKKRLFKEVGQGQMLRCIERYKESVRGRDEQFIMHGSTFFNSGYVDYLDSNVESTQPEAKAAAQSNVRSDGRTWQ